VRDLGVVQKHSKPNHPTTCGKVERFRHKRWRNGSQPSPTPAPHTVAEFQVLCDTFIACCNNARPHRSLNRRTPLAATTKPVTLAIPQQSRAEGSGCPICLATSHGVPGGIRIPNLL